MYAMKMAHRSSDTTDPASTTCAHTGITSFANGGKAGIGDCGSDAGGVNGGGRAGGAMGGTGGGCGGAMGGTGGGGGLCAFGQISNPRADIMHFGGAGGEDGGRDTGSGDGGDGELPHAAQVSRQPTRSLPWYRPFSHRLLQLAVHSSLDSPSSKMNRQAQPHPEPSPSAHEPPWA